MTETPSQLTQLVHNLYQEMEQGLIKAWQQKLQDPVFLRQLVDSNTLKNDIETICREVLAQEAITEQMQETIQIISLLQEQVELETTALRTTVDQLPSPPSKEEIEEICRTLLSEESSKEELQSIVQIITLMQQQIERNSNELDEKVSEVDQYQKLVQSMSKRLDGLEKSFLQHRMEASETRLDSIQRCEALEQQIETVKRQALRNISF